MFNLVDFHWRSVDLWLKIWIIVSLTAEFCAAACYFPTEIQGEYVTQSTVDGNEVKYSRLNITEDSIPIWGHCFRKINKNVILQIELEESSCFRCFQLKLVARNVLRVLTSDQDYISKCYTTETKAEASCPQQDSDEGNRSDLTEIVLYKTKEWDNQPIRREYCPFTGRFKLSYNIDDGLEDKVECSTKKSELDSCPSGSAMNLRFRQCSFENHEVTFECLGNWIGPNQQKYLALMNAKTDEKLGPQYRCAIYQTNVKTGVVQIAFSNDSTCAAINHEEHISLVKNSKSRGPSPKYSEVLTLHPVPEDSWPTYLTYSQFPSWMLGNWQHLRIKKDVLLYRDHTSFKTYTIRRLETAGSVPANKYLVYSRTQCDEIAYQCLWIEKRSDYVLEFQVGSKTSKNRSEELCADEYFDVTRWMTQGKFLNEDKNVVANTPCSISGDFTGYIPDAAGLCAKLSSECKSTDIMHYAVSACDFDEVYEEREYTCLGHWQEKGLVYAFTHRKDVGGYECFVGAMLSDKQIYIKEAGEHCQRQDPYRYGMELNQVAHCNNVPDSSITNLLSHSTHPKVLTPKFPSLSNLPDLPLGSLDTFNNGNIHQFDTRYQNTHYEDESNNGFPGAVQQHPHSYQPDQVDNSRSRSSTARTKVNTESRDNKFGSMTPNGSGFNDMGGDNEEDNTIPGSSTATRCDAIHLFSAALIALISLLLLH